MRFINYQMLGFNSPTQFPAHEQEYHIILTLTLSLPSPSGVWHQQVGEDKVSGRGAEPYRQPAELLFCCPREVRPQAVQPVDVSTHA